jgi:hypothetical protein
LKINNTFEGGDDSKLMRKSIGLAEYEKKLAELQHRIISVHTPYNDTQNLVERSLFPSAAGTYVNNIEVNS